MRDLEQSGTESRVLAARSWGWGGALIPSEHRVSVCKRKRVLETGGSDSGTTMRMYLMSSSCTPG